MEQRDGIVDLGAETGMKKHERGSDRLRSGSKPNSIGATHNHAIGRMTHSQASNSVAQAPALMVSHARLFQGNSDSVDQNTEKFQGLARINTRTDIARTAARCRAVMRL